MRFIARTILTLLLLFPTVAAQSTSVLLQQAIHAEQAAGDLETAIDLYRAIIASVGSPRASVAQARFRLAFSYLKSGRPQEAAATFREVVLLYPEEEQLSAVARRQLSALSGVAPSWTAETADQPRFTVLRDRTLRTQSTVEFDVSPDGKRMVFIDSWPNPEASGPWTGVGIRNGMANVSLYVSDRSGAQVRPLLKDWGAGRADVPPPGDRGSMEWIGSIRWSPDGRWIFFSVRQVSEDYAGDLATAPREAAPEERRKAYEVAFYVVDAGGGSPRQLGAALPSDYDSLPLGWTRDSRQVAFFKPSTGTLYHRSLDGRDSTAAQLGTRKFESSWQFGMSISFGDYSPDGRWLIFSDRRSLAESERHLWLVPADGGTPRKLTSNATVCSVFPPPLNADVSRPAWAPDGSAVYFHHLGNIWKQAFDSDEGQLLSEPEQVTFFEDAQVNHVRVVHASGDLVFALSKTRSQLVVADTANRQSAVSLGRGHSPQLSPDGRTVYFRGEGPGQEGIFRVDRDGENRRRLTEAGVDPADLTEVRPLALSPDGSTLAFVAESGRGRALYVIPTGGGSPRQLVQIAGSFTDSATWSPDGSRLAFVSGSELLTVAATGGSTTRIGEVDDWYYHQAHWSPDGDLLAASGRNEEENPDGTSVFVFAADGSGGRRLIRSETDVECLVWHPSGGTLSFFDYRDALHHTVDLQRNIGPALFDHAPSWEYCGGWDPEGRRFYFSGAVDEGNWRLFVFDRVTGRFSDFETVGDNVIGQSTPVWSRDGSAIAWSRTAMHRQIWLMETRPKR